MEKQKISGKVVKTKFFWAFFILAALGIVLGTFLLPVWDGVNVFWKDWSKTSISIILFCLILIYVVWYLLKMIKKEDRKAVKVLSIVEMSLLGVIAVVCILQQFNVIKIFGPCFVFGAIFWLRGCIYIVKAYFYQHKKKESFSVTMLVLAIALVTGGTFFMSNKDTFNGNDGFIWIVSVVVLALSLALIVYGIMAKPKEEKAEEQATVENKPTTEKPVKPAAEKPAKPTAEKPAKPTAEKPAKPTAEKPAKPAAEKPAKPATEKPAKPAAEKPAKPAAEKPAKPATEKPAKPAVEKPTKPATEKPVDAEQSDK